MGARLPGPIMAVCAVLLHGVLIPSFGAAASDSHACSKTPILSRFEYSRIVMGVPARIIVYAPDAATAEAGCLKAFGRLSALEEMMSDYRADSELNRLCAQSGGPPVRVSRDLLYVLSRAREISERSDGAFDVTIGPLVRLWRAARKSGLLPPKPELDAAMNLVGWRSLRVCSADSTVQLLKSGMKLDLGGIAKGYACDEALRVLRKCGVRSAMIEMGGDIVAGNAPPGTNGWVIEIPNSRGNEGRHLLHNTAVSTSGDTEQYVVIGGTRYSHIVDPRTGLGLVNRPGVTVIARRGILADALSTALNVLGREKGSALVRQYEGVKAFFGPEP